MGSSNRDEYYIGNRKTSNEIYFKTRKLQVSLSLLVTEFLLLMTLVVSLTVTQDPILLLELSSLVQIESTTRSLLMLLILLIST